MVDKRHHIDLKSKVAKHKRATKSTQRRQMNAENSEENMEYGVERATNWIQNSYEQSKWKWATRLSHRTILWPYSLVLFVCVVLTFRNEDIFFFLVFRFSISHFLLRFMCMCVSTPFQTIWCHHNLHCWSFVYHRLCPAKCMFIPPNIPIHIVKKRKALHQLRNKLNTTWNTWKQKKNPETNWNARCCHCLYDLLK